MKNLSQWSSKDRDEWLSAYIDNELAPHDRQVVEEWLAQDPEYQACYQRLLRMQQGFQELRSQEMAHLPHLSPQCVLTQIPRVSPSPPLPWNQASRYGFAWKQRLMIALAGVSGLGIAFLWATGLRQPWAEPVAQVQSSPQESVAIVPSPLNSPTTKVVSVESSSTPAATSASSTTLVSTEAPAEPGLTFALDQPFLALPPE